MRCPSCLITLALVGCIDYAAPEAPAALEVLEVRPEVVGPEDPVVLTTSISVLAAQIEVRRGVVTVPCGVELEGARVVLRPRPAWPEGERLQVVALGVVTSPEGARTAPEGPLASFLVQASPEAAALGFVGPLQAPANLRWLLVSADEAALEADGPVALAGYGPPRVGAVTAKGEGLALVALEAGQTACEGPCAARRFQVRAMRSARDLGWVETSSVVDRRAPRVEWVDPSVRGDGVRIQVFADEPVVVQGFLQSAEGRVELPPPPQLAEHVVIGVRGLAPSTRYEVRLEVRDLAGNPAEVPVVAVQTADVPALEISELVAAPLRDWSDSDGMGVPFDAWPGLGAVTDNDEWIELVNRSGRVVDLMHAGLEIHALDTSPSVTPVDAAPGLFFGAGGAVRTWLPDEALVVRPRGSLSQRSLRIEVWGAGVLLDALTLGAEDSAVHSGGAPPDALHEAIARDAAGAWRWCIPTPGRAERSPRCR